MVTVDKSRRLYSLYRPTDPKIPPINSNPGRIFPEEKGDDHEEESDSEKN